MGRIMHACEARAISDSASRMVEKEEILIDDLIEIAARGGSYFIDIPHFRHEREMRQRLKLKGYKVFNCINEGTIIHFIRISWEEATFPTVPFNQ